MKIKFKNLVLCSALLSCYVASNISNAAMWNRQNNFGAFYNNNVMQNNNNIGPAPLANNNFNNNNNWNQNNFNNNWNQNNFNNNIVIQNNIQQFLINQNINSKDGIITNWQSVNKFDWQLFQQNIRNYASARTTAIRSLRSLFIGNGSQNFLNPNDSNEISLRLECSKLVGGLINFYSGNFNKITEVYTYPPTLELFTMIANYYIMSLSNGYDISTVQNSLQTLSWQQSWMLTTILQNHGYQAYYQNYFLPRQFYTLQASGNVRNPFLPNTITLQDWNRAVTMVKHIDLAGCLKKLIKGVNVANYFENFRRCDNKTNNAQINLNNGVGKCAFNSMFQLLSSNLQKMKASNIVSPMTSGYFADFDRYLRIKQAQTGRALTLIDELWNFEQTLTGEQLSDWNSDGNVLQAKNKLKKMHKEYSNEHYITVLDLFSKIFPELRELYDDNWKLNTIARDWDSEQFYKIDNSKNYLLFSGVGNSGMGLLNAGVQKNVLFNEINNNQYMIDFDKQGKLFMYELTGLQLSAPGHNVVYSKYDNSHSNWRVVDSNNIEHSSTYGMQLGGIFQDNKFKYLKEYAGVAAYMFKKISPQEFIRSMPQCLVL